jgi:hypothetical protein
MCLPKKVKYMARVEIASTPDFGDLAGEAEG